MNEYTKMELEQKTKKKEAAETENQDTTCTSRTAVQSTPHLKKRWLHKARNNIGIVTPLSTIAMGSGSEVITNTAVCSKDGVSSETAENEKRTFENDMKTCSHDGCYDNAKDGGACMKYKEEDLLRQWFQTQFTGSH